MFTPNCLSRSEIIGALAGMTLGDANVYMRQKNACIRIDHSTKQTEYCLWKREIVEKVIHTRLNYWTHFNPVTNKEYYHIRFASLVHPVFTYLHSCFYPNNKKLITRSNLRMLSPLGLAIWYMDDGSMSWHKGMRGNFKIIIGRESIIAANSRTIEELETVKSYFKLYWDITVKIYKSQYRKGRQEYRIVMNVTNFHRFFKLIEPFVVKSMQYKVDLKYKWESGKALNNKIRSLESWTGGVLGKEIAEKSKMMR